MPKTATSLPPARKASVPAADSPMSPTKPARGTPQTSKAPAAKKAVSAKAPTKTIAQAKKSMSEQAVPKPVKAKLKPVAAEAPASKPIKVKAKLVRDSFAMPAADFALIDALKERALGFRRPTKKSELLRAGLRALTALTAEQLNGALSQLEPLKPGRPKKES